MTSRRPTKAARWLTYREHAAGDDMSHLVWAYWEFTVATAADRPLVHEVFADGCVSLLFHRNTARGMAGLHIVGIRLDSLLTEVFPGDIYWGARLSPAACRFVLGCAPARLRNQVVDLSKLLPELAEELFPRLEAASSFAESMAAYGSCLSSTGVAPADVDAAIAAAVRYIERTKGQASIGKVAATVGISVRQLQRRFRGCVGLTPKQFARIRRVRTAAIDLLEGGGTNWAMRAFDMGFSDQSHLTREFVAVTGRSPVSFADDVDRINHGDLL